MSKKHFKDLAARLKYMRPSGENKHASTKIKHLAKGRLEQWREMVRGLADFCAMQNDRFDRNMFLTAVGLDD